MTREAPLSPEALQSEFGPRTERSWQSFGMVALELRAENLLTVVTALRDKFDFTLFLDVTAIDYPEQTRHILEQPYVAQMPDASDIRYRKNVE